MSPVIAFILTRVALPAAIALAIFGWGYSVGSAGEARKRTNEQQAQLRQQVADEQEARAEEFWRATRWQGVLDERDRFLRAHRAHMAADRSTVDGVRHAAAAIADRAASGPADACGPCRARVAELAGLLAEGAELAAEGEDHVGELRANVTALQQRARLRLGGPLQPAGPAEESGLQPNAAGMAAHSEH